MFAAHLGLSLRANYSEPIMTQTGDPLPFRNCDGCTLCCKVMRVDVLNKPGGKWCQHCKIGEGCGIHEMRPDECRAFYCGYLTYPVFDERWKPSVAHLLARMDSGSGWVGIHVDPQRPDAWRREPYYSGIKEMAKKAQKSQLVVMVFIGKRVWAVYPDKDVDLGEAKKGYKTIRRQLLTPNGPRYEVRFEPPSYVPMKQENASSGSANYFAMEP